MTQQPTSSPSPNEPGQVHEHLPGRFVGVVVRDTTRSNGYLFLRGADGTEYFSHRASWFDAPLFVTIMLGEAVSFRVTRTSKGLRAWDVRAPTVDEAPAVSELTEAIAAAQANEHRVEELRDQTPRGKRQRQQGDDHGNR